MVQATDHRSFVGQPLEHRHDLICSHIHKHLITLSLCMSTWAYLQLNLTYFQQAPVDHRLKLPITIIIGLIPENYLFPHNND